MNENRPSKQRACHHDALRFDEMTASFCRETLGGSPVLTIHDGGHESWIDLSWAEANALRDWLNSALSDEPPAALCVDPVFKGTRCPFTKRPYMMHIEHAELGRVPTYGGPFDSYTIPEPDEEGHLHYERYDHDAGDWVDGGEPTGLLVISDRELSRLSEPPGDGWQPIETAPKDGSDLLLAKIVGHIDHPTAVWWMVKGSWSLKWNKWWDGIEPCGLAGPTHWMPIPRRLALTKEVSR